MSTSSIIGQIVNDKVKSIYCHWDGYPTGKGSVGGTLKSYYKDPETISALMRLGDLSMLGDTPVDNPDSWDYRKAYDPSRCVSYRSRGDVNTDAHTSCSVEAFIAYATSNHVDYVYLFDGLSWRVLDKHQKEFIPY